MRYPEFKVHAQPATRGLDSARVHQNNKTVTRTELVETKENVEHAHVPRQALIIESQMYMYRLVTGQKN